MAVNNEVKRNVPPYPDPRDTDQGRINRQIIELIKFIVNKDRAVKAEDRLATIEKKLDEFESIING